MIVRIWQARPLPGRLDDLCEALRAHTWLHVREADGFVGGEIYRSVEGSGSVVMITRWRDDAALEKWAGRMWRMRPVDTPEEYMLLAELDTVQHFELIDTA